MIKPMLCKKTTKEELNAFKGIWKANIKYDGERIIAVKKGDDVFLFNRRGKLKNSFYMEVVEDLSAFKDDFIIDGEVISLDDDFNKLQKRALTQNPIKQKQLRKDVPVTYMVFDILNYKVEDLKNMPLKNRLTYLNHLLNSINDKNLLSIGYVAYEDINECLNYAKNNNCEGIIIKNMNSTYEENKRSNNWLKLKFFKFTELTLTNYTINNAGIRCEDKELNAVQISGQQHKEVKDKIDNVGYCEVTIQYLEQSKTTKRYRFPSFIEVKNG